MPSNVKARVDIERLRLNRQLKKQGRKICSICERNLPLDDQHFHVTNEMKRGKPYRRFRAECRDCWCFVTAERERKRYRTSKAFRERKRDYRRRYYAVPEHREHHRQIGRVYMRQRRAKQRIERLNAIVRQIRVAR